MNVVSMGLEICIASGICSSHVEIVKGHQEFSMLVLLDNVTPIGLAHKFLALQVS